MTTPEEQSVLHHAGRRLLQIVGMLENGWAVELNHHDDRSGTRLQWLRDGARKVYSVYFRKLIGEQFRIVIGRDADFDKALEQALEKAKKLEIG